MQIRRCAVLLIEPRENLSFDLESLIAGGDGLALNQRLLALAPHVGAEIELDADDVALLAATSATQWTPLGDLCTRFDAQRVRDLLHKGLLLGEGDEYADWLRRDEQVRARNWWTPAAVAHYFGRWNEVSSVEGSRLHGFRTMSELADTLGAPPPHVAEKTHHAARIALPRAAATAFDALLDRRVTCRNFDTGRALPQDVFAQLIERVFAARGQIEVRPDTTVLKRTSPSGGGLHPIEAYVLVRDVEGVAPGLYHYHAVSHALEPLRQVDAKAVYDASLRAVAAQEYYAEAHATVVLVARFARNFWKYRNHTKAYRVIVLDAGHLSQTLYLSATEAGLGAFVTGAINEVEIEQLLGLDPLEESPIAVCGFGWRGDTKQTVEFDPLQRIWPTAPAA